MMASYGCYEKSYLLCECESISTCAGFSSLMQLIGSLIRNTNILKFIIYINALKQFVTNYIINLIFYRF